MGSRCGVKITDTRDGQSIKLYRENNGHPEDTGIELENHISQYIGRIENFNLYELMTEIYDEKKYKRVEESYWDEEYRYFINIINDTEIKYIITQKDWNTSNNPKETEYKVLESKIYNINSDKPIYKVEFSQQELDFLKLHLNKIINDEEIIPNVVSLAKSILDKF